MRRIIAIAIACMAASTGLASMYNFMQPSRYLDARYAGELSFGQTSLSEDLYGITLPDGQHSAFTVTAWMRVLCTNDIAIAPQAFWHPDAIQYSNPDLLAGAGGHGTGGTNLTTAGGSITVADFPWQPYTDVTLSNLWPRGVYTIDGWSSNAVTVSLGGADVSVGPGDFNRNALPGSGDSVTLAGTGPAEIGISRTPGVQFYSISGMGFYGGSQTVSRDTIITNEISFITWRFSSGGGVQTCTITVGRMGETITATKTLVVPASACGCFDSRGLYRIGLTGFHNAPIKTVELVDYRLLPWWLTDAELDRVHRNGVQEINRRGIPKWRAP